jgi:uncharacterized hydrophobic protein (TIGR00271 family)
MNTERERPLTALGSLIPRILPSQSWSDDDRAEVVADLYPEGADAAPFTWRFVTLIVLSTVIAALGLVANSAAVVIGAMLIAPLMTPILGVAVAIVLGEPRRLVTSIALVGAGILLAIGAAYVVTAIAPGTVTANELTSELLARTEPSLLDLGVAVAAGLAAGYVLVHPKAGSSLPGVAIAVALVPPLASVGIALQLGAGSEAQGAFLLFATNLLAIVLAAMIVALASGFTPIRFRDALRSGAGRGLAVTAVMLLLVAVPLSFHTIEVVEDHSFTLTAVSVVGDWDPNGTIVDLSADVDSAGDGSVTVVMSTGGEPVPAWRLAQALRERTGRAVAVDVQYIVESIDSAVSG